MRHTSVVSIEYPDELLVSLQENLIESVLPFAYELREKGIWINDTLINYVKEIEQAG